MAVYSMTGYATAAAGTPVAGAESPGPGAAVTVEARSVNGRFLDLAFRLPDELRGLEPALRELLVAGFRRGKIELRLNSRSGADTQWPRPQPDQLMQLARLESTVQGWMPKAGGLSVHEILQWCKGSAPAERLDDELVIGITKRC